LAPIIVTRRGKGTNDDDVFKNQNAKLDLRLTQRTGRVRDWATKPHLERKRCRWYTIAAKKVKTMRRRLRGTLAIQLGSSERLRTLVFNPTNE
jgi:hypothetical protein